ncbi:putative Ig domain-containing protein [Curtobacterium luteum]|uniref:putative Ig domain-containing protein n=1 Tax=Curtobacterium luteum TaxID=33881 RepID=UPI003810DE82
MRRSTSTVRRACALGTTAALVVLTTGLGVMTATAANAETVTEPTPTATVDPTPSDASTDPTTDPTASPTGEPDSSATADPAPTTDEPTPAETTAPAKPLVPGSGSSTQDVTPAAVAAPTVTITGTAKVGSTLKATTTGFDKELATPEFVWTNKATKAQLSTDQFYDIQPTDAGAVIVVTVSGKDSEGNDVDATAETATEVTQDPVFVDASGTPIEGGTAADEDTLFIDDATAGEAYSYTFRAEGYPAPTYQLSWYYGDEEDSIGNVVETQSQAAAENTIDAGFSPDEDVNGDGKITPDDQLPKGITFDPATGELSGTATQAMWYDFAVTATSGDVSTTQYVEQTVDPGAAYGLAAEALDAGLLEGEKGALYIIRPDGSVIGFRVDPEDGDIFLDDSDLLDHVSVKQGGTLLVYGTPVDRFGNDVYPEDENDVVQATVTSDVASDVIKPYTKHGAEGYGVSSVTFPHAATHRLTVSAQALEPVSFDVEVTPTVAPAVVVTPTATGTGTGVQLAYTGSDATGALPWALGLVLAGAGLIGARTLRRRRAQR